MLYCLLCWGLTTRQPLRVILCRLPEKGRKEIEERVERWKRGTGKKEEQEWKWRNRRNKNIPPLPLPTTRIASRPCSTVSLRFDALTELGAFMRTEFLCIYVLRVASGPRVKLASCKSALNPPVVCSTDRFKAVVPVLVLLLVALWFILRGDLLYVFPCVILFLCFSVLLVLRFLA